MRASMRARFTACWNSIAIPTPSRPGPRSRPPWPYLAWVSGHASYGSSTAGGTAPKRSAASQPVGRSTVSGQSRASQVATHVQRAGAGAGVEPLVEAGRIRVAVELGDADVDLARRLRAVDDAQHALRARERTQLADRHHRPVGVLHVREEQHAGLRGDRAGESRDDRLRRRPATPSCGSCVTLRPRRFASSSHG